MTNGMSIDENTPLRSDNGAVGVWVQQKDGKVVELTADVYAHAWRLEAQMMDDGAWRLSRSDHATVARHETWTGVFDAIPEAYGDAPLRRQVCELVDRAGQTRINGRSVLHQELEDALERLKTLYGEREAASFLAQAAGQMGLRLYADPDMPEEVKGPAYAAAAGEGEDNPV